MRFGLSVVALACAVLTGGAAPSGYRVLARVALPGEGTWDYVKVDEQANRVYISHETQVQVLDSRSLRLLATIPNTPGVHGIAIAPEFHRGFISAGLASTVIVFDTRTLKETARLPAGQKPDCILYDPATKRVFAMNGDSGTTTVIEAATSKVERTVELGGGPEFSVADGEGNIFINLKAQDHLIQFDSRSLTVVNRWPTSPCSTPASLAVDVANHRLFLGCRSKVMAVMDSSNGRVVASYPIGDHVDATAYDPGSKFVINSTGEGNIAIFHQDSPDEYSIVETIATSPGAKTFGLDHHTHRIFLPEKLEDRFNVVVYGR
jgi:YVTN family beta-propeller protein